MTSPLLVDLSRLQFALTAMYHFLFVPLTLGLSVLVAMMETVYVMTGRTIWRDMTKFWGLLFGINFALGVATGLTMEFEFGMNWAFYSHYVGDIFGAPLAIEGLMAFFLEATFVGLFFFGWDKLSARAHLAVTWLVALGSNLSALWILIANGWMQHPVGAAFNPDTMRMEVTDFTAVLLNPTAQAKFVHTVSAGYVCGATFVLGVSAFYLLRGRHVQFAKRSFVIASAFGVAAALSVIVLGDESGYTITDNQKMKLAAMEAMWHTEPAPAAITAIGIPDMETHTTRYDVDIPWLMGLIGTRSFDKQIPGIFELVQTTENRIRNGLVAYDALQKLKANHADADARATFERTRDDLGYALAAQALCRGTVPGDAATDRTGGVVHCSQRPLHVLRLPLHGAVWLHAAGRVLDLAVAHHARGGGAALAVVAGALGASAAVAGGGARLVCRRVRTPALDHRRRAADFPRDLRTRRLRSGADDHRLYRRLRGPGGDRGDADAARHQEGP